jgi:SAM-dependent methyltransferase
MQAGMTAPDPADAQLAAQYEAYPYPARDAREEAKRLILGSPSHLREIDHWVFGGRRPASQPLRALVAGGGTGDGAIMLAQQLAERAPQGRVTYLDLSRASRAVAEERARVRALRNIAFVEGSLLNVAALAPGPFDYIDCCGVLHHLPDPAAGLAALAAVLRPGGGMGLMLYGALGRTGVYPMQDALRLLVPAGGGTAGPGGTGQAAVEADAGNRLAAQEPLDHGPYQGRRCRPV